MVRLNTRYITLCVHLSMNLTSLKGVSGMSMKHNTQIPAMMIQLNGNRVKICRYNFIFYF